MLTIGFIPVPTDEAVKELQNKLLSAETNIAQWQRKQNQANNFSSAIPYDMEQQRTETTEFLNDLSARDQRMLFTLVSIVHLADSKARLDQDTETLQAKASGHMCELGVLRYQQLPGLQTTLPFGIRRIHVLRTLTTEGLAILTPFRSQEIIQPGGFFLGINPTTGNPILLDRSLLLNPNFFILGVPGSGKSILLKEIIIAMALGTEDDILICDPEGEFSALVGALGGEVARIAVGSGAYINAMELSEGYSDSKKPWLEKSEFILSLIEQLDKKGLGLDEKSVLDRCLDLAYEDYLQGAPMPTLCALRQKLLMQPEPVAKNLAFRGGGIGKHRPEGGIFGQLHCHRREEYHSGYASLLFHASAANPPPSGAQRPFPSHLFRRKAGGRRQGGSPSKAGQHSAGANGAEMDRCFPMSPPL